MKKNMGNTDRLIRLLIALVALALYIGDVLQGTMGYVALAVAAVMVLTSTVRVCPLYLPFGIDTCERERKA